MSKKSKRIQAAEREIEKRLYKAVEALELLKKVATAGFNETAEAHIVLGINPKYNDQKLRATVSLPKGTGKKIILAVITKEDPENIKKLGADIVGGEDLIDEILSTGQLNFDQLIVTPDMMPLIAKLGRILGPRGLMPSPKAGSVTTNIERAIMEFKGGKLEYRADKTGIVHIPFGKLDFSTQDLLENLTAVQESISRNKPPGAKGNYWKSFFISATMSPSIQIEIKTFQEKIYA